MPDVAAAERRGKEADNDNLLVKENAGAKGSGVEIFQRKTSQSQRYKTVGWFMVGGIILVSLLNMAMATGSIGMGRASRSDPAGAGSTIAHLEKTLLHPPADDDSWDSSEDIEKPGHTEHFEAREGNEIPSYIPCGWYPAKKPGQTLTIIVGGTVYSPDNIGRKDVLIGGGKILGIFEPDAPEVEMLVGSGLCNTVNASGTSVVPGLVDIHVHVTGGGGESGPESKVPEAQISQLVKAGITTVVGILGTDSLSRSVSELLTKVNALNRGPITAYMWTGAYKTSPAVPTIIGSVEQDVAFIGPCIGVKTAVSDHRSSQESKITLREIASQARVAGMLGGKAGLVYAHMGDGPGGLAPLRDIIENTPIPITQILPTHMGRTEQLVVEGIAWVSKGGRVDVTANPEAPRVIKRYLDAEADLSLISVSSDAYGSLPQFDDAKQLVGYSYSKPTRLLQFVRDMVFKHGWKLEHVLPFVTSNPSRTTALRKGTLEVGGDADVLCLDGKLKPVYVISKGLPVKTPVCTAKGMFELSV